MGASPASPRLGRSRPVGGPFAGLVRLLTAEDRTGLWIVSLDGTPIGSILADGRGRRLTWFEGADPRLAGLAGPVDDDLDALAETLARRLGARDAAGAGLLIRALPV